MTLHNQIALYDSLGTLLSWDEITHRLNKKCALYFRINYKKHHEFKAVPSFCNTPRDIYLYALGYVEILKADLVLTDYLF